MSQIKITLDFDNILIEMDGIQFTPKGSLTEYKNFLIELFNVIEPSNLILEEIDEDVRRTIDEW